MYKLLIADSSESYTSALQAIFQKEFQLRICPDGETALEQLRDFRPDALIINLMLPYKDGLTVLQETPHRPRVILAITPFMSAYVQKAAEELGVQYLTILPSVNSLRVRLMDLVATTIAPKEDLNAQAAVLLHSLNFTPHLDGYQQLCAAIPLYARNPGFRLCKELYPQVAEALQLSDPRTVEHSIRKAITSAWSHMDPVVWKKFFPVGEAGRLPCPTNKEFIARLAEFIEL
jgi:two-component system response regulator (stage 0 sporulation protein A)